MNTARLCVIVPFALLSSTESSAAQCLETQPAFPGGIARSAAGVTASAQVVWDDGNGPALFIAGRFDTAQDVVADSIVRWDGTSFTPLGDAEFEPEGDEGNGMVYDLAVHDDGSGPALYASGRFTSISGVPAHLVARWNGSSWSALASASPNKPLGWGAYALESFDDGNGAKLYVAGGLYRTNINSPFRNLAVWDGTDWSWPGYITETVFTLETFDLGAGLQLFAGMQVPSFGNREGVSIWNGAEFVELGPDFFDAPDAIGSLAVLDSGSGPELYASGYLPSIGTGVARWNGTTWSSTGAPLSAGTLTVFDDGTGEKLWTPAAQLMSFDGSAWTAHGGSFSGYGYALTPFDDGTGAKLHVGGRFDAIGAVDAECVARFSNGSWSALAQESAASASSIADALVNFDDGTGPTIYRAVATATGDVVQRWNGASFVPLGAASDGDVIVLAAYDDGGGAKLYAGGAFNQIGGVASAGIARWNGVAWEALAGGGIAGAAREVRALVTHSFGGVSKLVTAGDFATIGGVATEGIGAWDGSNWVTVGGGLDGTIHCLASYDAGAGAELYAGGQFFNGSGNFCRKVARWDGAAWQPCGDGFNGTVLALAVYDDGGGARLYAGGQFWKTGTLVVDSIARWNGSSWSAMPGGGANARVRGLHVADDGFASALYVAGDFTVPANRIARFDAAGWHAVGTGANYDAWRVASLALPHGRRELWLAGEFDIVDGVAAHRMARYVESAPCAPQSYCTAKLNSQACLPAIGSSGVASASASTFAVNASNVLNQKNGLLFWGYARAATPYQGGTLCVKSPLVRTPLQNTGGNAPPDDCSGTMSYAFTTSYFASRAVVAGDRLFSQMWHRDPASAQPSGLTAGLSFLIEP